MHSGGLRLTDDYTTFIRVSYRKEFLPRVLLTFFLIGCSPSYDQEHFRIEPEAIYSCKIMTTGFMLCLEDICITQATQDDGSKWCGRIAGWSPQGSRRGDFDDLQTNNWSPTGEIVADCSHHFPIWWWPLFFFFQGTRFSFEASNGNWGTTGNCNWHLKILPQKYGKLLWNIHLWMRICKMHLDIPLVTCIWCLLLAESCWQVEKELQHQRQHHEAAMDNILLQVPIDGFAHVSPCGTTGNAPKWLVLRLRGNIWEKTWHMSQL